MSKLERFAPVVIGFKHRLKLTQVTRFFWPYGD